MSFFANILILCIVILIILLSVNYGHILHGSYKWKFNRPIFYFVHRIYMRIEWAVMLIALKFSRSWLIQHCKILRTWISNFLFQFAGGEVYTLKECNGILDALFREYPNVYVGIRICPCRQSRNLYDKNISNITDLTFVFSKNPGKKKHQRYTTYISLEEAKRLMAKFEREGFFHAMYGACERYVDCSIGLTICNCKKGICIPLDMKMKYDIFKYHKGHNLAIIDSKKCIGVEKCGKCVEYCYFDARVKDKNTGKIKVLNDKCLGCGLCVSHCPENANHLKFLPQRRIYFYENVFRLIRKKHANKVKSWPNI